MKTLIVDDDPEVILVLSKYLGRYGFCVSAENGAAALREFERAQAAGTPFDLVTLDIHMPELDGKETLQKIRALEVARASERPAAIIMISAISTMDNMLASFERLCNSFLAKPVSLAHLTEELVRLKLLPADTPQSTIE